MGTPRIPPSKLSTVLRPASAPGGTKDYYSMQEKCSFSAWFQHFPESALLIALLFWEDVETHQIELNFIDISCKNPLAAACPHPTHQLGQKRPS